MASVDTAWESLKGRLTELEALGGVVQLLEWDQQTMMPKGGGSQRGAQLSTLTGIMHDRLADPQVGSWLAALCDETIT